ncbi:unnamed protein product [Toxocara canis]|uniref:G_PROTEIN_RECEP_F1_2 domain-containing protein n=1 Tax=Toxocara canis TaxID=6265 RepID=A0A183U0J8_TOXCA|nr:unnamed protein product [Toxocara canis]
MTDIAGSSSSYRSRADNVTASACIVLVSTAGVVLNSSSIYIVFTSKHFPHAYGILCVVRNIHNLIVLTLIPLWGVPSILMEGPWQKPELGVVIGQLINSSYYGVIWTHLFIAINRFIAINYALLYNRIYTNRRALIASVVIWICTFSATSIYYVGGCSLLFYRSLYQFNFDDAPCGHFLSLYIDFGSVMFVLSAMTIVDLANLIRLRMKSKEAGEAMKSSVNITGEKRRRKRDIRFFVQAGYRCIQLQANDSGHMSDIECRVGEAHKHMRQHNSRSPPRTAPPNFPSTALYNPE